MSTRRLVPHHSGSVITCKRSMDYERRLQRSDQWKSLEAQGQCFMGARAVAAGLADEMVQDLAAVIEDLEAGS